MPTKIRTYLMGLVLALAAGCSDNTNTNPPSPDFSTGTKPDLAMAAAPDLTMTPQPDLAMAPPVYAAVVRGMLVSNDLAMDKKIHDMIASGGEAQAKAAGDFAHQVLLGIPILDGKQDEFLAIDRWHDANAMMGFYADPKFQAAFNQLFAAPPTIEFFVARPDWVNWGDMNSGDAFNPYFFHFALGQLHLADVTQNQMAHDMVASGGMAPAMQAGNVAHVVYLGLSDQRRFLAVDIWKSSDNIQAFYTNPQFVQAFAPLFDSVSQPMFQSTDWHQW